MALVQADVNSATELDVSAFWKLESAEFRRQKVTVHSVEILEQIRIHGATGGTNNNSYYSLCSRSKIIIIQPRYYILFYENKRSPVDDNSLLLRLGIRDKHVGDQQSVNRRGSVVQEDLHLQRRAWANVQLSGDQISALPHTDPQYRYGRRFGDLPSDVDHAAR